MEALETHFAPPERDLRSEIRESAHRIEAAGCFRVVLDALPEIVLVLNDKRQIVFANNVAVSALGGDAQSLLRLRPGEAVSCIHAKEMKAGCGTSDSCRYCGAIHAVLEAQQSDAKVSRECRIILERDGKLKPLDLLVTGKNVNDGRHRYTVVTIQDISDAKRRGVLERIFFHDIINSIAVLQSSAAILKNESESGEYLDTLIASSGFLLDEVVKQRDFLAMERGDLAVSPEPVSCSAVVHEVAAAFSADVRGRGAILSVEEGSAADMRLRTDPVLLRRVLSNMVKNALEASVAGDRVTIGVSAIETGARFSVRNPAVMSEEVRLQIFQRSFSTKGSGRGIGTYSIRMLVRDYLKGDVGFTSQEGEGTNFWVDIPADGV